MTPELEALKEVAHRLERGGFLYMLTGSVAMSMFVMPRMTRDVDLVVEVTSARAPDLVELFDGDFYVSSDAVRSAVATRGMFNILYLRGSIKVDLIIRKDSAYRMEEFHRRQKVDRLGFPLWVVSREDLILSKLEWARDSRSEQQYGDVRALLAGTVDREYLRRWAAELGVQADLEACINARHRS